MSYVTEKDWITKAGLRAVCIFARDSHRCGYVEVPKGHPLYEVDYHKDTVVLGKSPDLVFEVHGGLTYSGGQDDYPVNTDGESWWFGFDCAHLGDATAYHHEAGDVQRSDRYVVAECESLARQIVETV